MMTRWRRLAWIALALMASAHTAFGQQARKIVPSREVAKNRAAQIAAQPNVILITIDTLRADHVGCYGARDVKTPTLDGLAHDGVVFERAISQVPLTWPSHAVILTGTYPFQNGVQDFTGQPLGRDFRSVAQAFQKAGYATGAVVSAFVLDRSWGLGRGFDFYDDAFSAKTFQIKETGLVDRRAGESVAHAIAWLKKTRADGADKSVRPTQPPFFLWLHLYDPHSPYDPPEPYRTDYSTHLYDGEIAYADHELGSLMTWLKQNHLYDSSLIVMLSDHGESLGEHGEDEHGFFIYNATVHVPLIVKPPAGSGIPAGRMSEPVETAAVAPTLLELAGVKDAIEAQFQSRALLGKKPGEKRVEKDLAYSETFYPFSSFGWSPLHALETARFHFIEAPKPELYDLASDPGETRNIAGEQPATVAVLQEKLQTLLAHNPFHGQDRGRGAGNLSPEAQDKLRALGYFGFRAAVSPESLKQGLADAKDKLGEFNSILKAEDAFHLGHDDEAEALLRRMQEQDPQIYVIPFLLGESDLRRENWEKAAAELERCLVLDPNFDNAMTGLARALAKLGRGEEAKSWLDKALQSNPQNYRAWYQKGLLEAGDPAVAQAAYEKAVGIQPNFSAGQREIGMLFFEQKDYAVAAPHLEKAIELGLDDARLHNFLGICYNRTNRTAKAVREFEHAIRLDPKLAEAHLNLAFARQLLHQSKAAREEYVTACKLNGQFCKYVPAE
jgi:choline-sulfatase